MSAPIQITSLSRIVSEIERNKKKLEDDQNKYRLYKKLEVYDRVILIVQKVDIHEIECKVTRADDLKLVGQLFVIRPSISSVLDRMLRDFMFITNYQPIVVGDELQIEAQRGYRNIPHTYEMKLTRKATNEAGTQEG